MQDCIFMRQGPCLLFHLDQGLREDLIGDTVVEVYCLEDKPGLDGEGLVISYDYILWALKNTLVRSAVKFEHEELRLTSVKEGRKIIWPRYVLRGRSPEQKIYFYKESAIWWEKIWPREVKDQWSEHFGVGVISQCQLLKTWRLGT